MKSCMGIKLVSLGLIPVLWTENETHNNHIKDNIIFDLKTIYIVFNTLYLLCNKQISYHYQVSSWKLDQIKPEGE